MNKSLIHTIEKPEKKIYIYGLCDPDTNELRYIGLTTIGFKRMIRHWNDCYIRSNQGHFSAIKNWVRSLKKQNKIFKPIYLEYFEKDNLNVDEAEIFWISYFKMIGCRLLNLDNGGRCEYLRFNSNDSKRKQSEACKKINGTSEKRAYFSKNTKEQWQNPEIRRQRIEAMQNKPRTEEQKNNMRLGNKKRFTLIDDLGNIYNSIHDAANKLQVGPMIIHRSLKSNKKVKERTLKKIDRGS